MVSSREHRFGKRGHGSMRDGKCMKIPDDAVEHISPRLCMTTIQTQPFDDRIWWLSWVDTFWQVHKTSPWNFGPCRLDQMLLVEHLKRKARALVSVKKHFVKSTVRLLYPFLHPKVMVAHTAFTEATDLLLKSHAWLVKDPMLGTHRKPCLFGSMYEMQFTAAKSLYMILPASSCTMVRNNVFFPWLAGLTAGRQICRVQLDFSDMLRI